MNVAAPALAAVSSSCAALQDPTVQYFDLRLPNMDVPSTSLTTYICKAFEANLQLPNFLDACRFTIKMKSFIPLPKDQEYHAVAFEPLIANKAVMHHMILFSCSGMADEMFEKHQCGSNDNHCRTWMAQWSMGIEGVICSHNQAGVRFGGSESSQLLLQIHWNNEALKSGLTDNSGMRVYFTSKLRPYNLGHVQVGQQDVEIPPGALRHAVSGGCSGQCTQQLLPHPIHLTSAHIHMHYLGAGGWLEVVHSNGTTTQVLFDDSYDYNHPVLHVLDNIVTVLPGDYLRLTCLFSSKDGAQKRTQTIYFGEGSDGEMCYAFISYFPLVHGFDQCLQFDVHEVNCAPNGYSEYLYCISRGQQDIISHFLPAAQEACNNHETDISCDLKSTCVQAMNSLYDHKCMQGRIGHYFKTRILPSLPSWKQTAVVQDHYIKQCTQSTIM
ncbi:hypothetical protein C0Q70_04024 [Pomacea canaliculata]|uniref:Copper type II ascorbate-dependent monooxygenase C-terminal domain-containing protein n=1 Tax=Pomacea canaliculata TaxID=400727 RepID=A0A2T7PUD5_POMCA|nr:hypothetical protein C0Q70_04024 [Pomacea canaliculata]